MIFMAMIAMIVIADLILPMVTAAIVVLLKASVTKTTIFMIFILTTRANVILISHNLHGCYE